MARRPDPQGPETGRDWLVNAMTEWLAAAKSALGISFDELWFLYRGPAGAAGVGIDAFRDYFNGKSVPQMADYQLIAIALNERLTEKGLEHEHVPMLMKVAPTGYGAVRQLWQDGVPRAA